MSFEFPEHPLGDATPVAALPKFSVPALMPKPRPFGLYRDLFKRVFDVSAIVLAAPLVVPLIAAAAVAVARDGGRPFYCQERVGKGGRIFRMWKLRSMVPDADAQLKGILASDPAMWSEWNTAQKLRNDPRITKVGRFLRRSSLDELPQLWNVLIGDMSLVGPRPMMPEQRALYPGTAYYALRPGITGYWQTSGRNRTTFHARAEYDAIYEEGVALRTDLRLLLNTVSVVVKGTGC